MSFKSPKVDAFRTVWRTDRHVREIVAVKSRIVEEGHVDMNDEQFAAAAQLLEGLDLGKYTRMWQNKPRRFKWRYKNAYNIAHEKDNLFLRYPIRGQAQRNFLHINLRLSPEMLASMKKHILTDEVTKEQAEGWIEQFLFTYFESLDRKLKRND